MKNEIVTKDHFSDLRDQIAGIKKENKEIVFNYEDPKGNKAARSHVYRLRQSKTAVAKRHKETKANILKEGREIDAAKNELTSDIEEMIEVHAAPIKAIDERRKAEEEARIAHTQLCADEEAAYAENILFNRERDIRLKEEEAARQEAELKQREEAERLERERMVREEQLQREAAEKATRAAEAKALKEKKDAERQIAEAKAAEGKAAQEKIEAEAKAERDAKEAEERRIRAAEEAEKNRIFSIQEAERKAEREKQQAIADEKAKQAAKEKAIRDAAEKKARQEAARVADIEHRKKINNEVLASLALIGIEGEDAKKLVIAIIKGQINNVILKY